MYDRVFNTIKSDESLRVCFGSVGCCLCWYNDGASIPENRLNASRVDYLLVSEFKLRPNRMNFECALFCVSAHFFLVHITASHFLFHCVTVFFFTLSLSRCGWNTFFGSEAQNVYLFVCVWISFIKCKPMKYMAVVWKAYKFHWCQRIRAEKPNSVFLKSYYK